MTMSFEAPQVDTSGRTDSLARRLLQGAGAASVDAYRLGECLPFVAHGLAEDGSLVVAARPTGLLGAVMAGSAVEVRLDVVKQTPDPSVTIVGSSLHLLGELTWATALEARGMVGLPPLVETMMEVPGTRLGVIVMERVVLHDLTGSTVIDPEVLYCEPDVIDDGYVGFELVARHDQTTLKDLCWAVMVEAAPGIVVSKAPLPHVCPHTADRVFVVDVDRLGVTLMLVGREETLLVFASFGAEVGSLDEMTCRIHSLMSVASLAA